MGKKDKKRPKYKDVENSKAYFVEPPSDQPNKNNKKGKKNGSKPNKNTKNIQSDETPLNFKNQKQPEPTPSVSTNYNKGQKYKIDKKGKNNYSKPNKHFKKLQQNENQSDVEEKEQAEHHPSVLINKKQSEKEITNKKEKENSTQNDDPTEIKTQPSARPLNITYEKQPEPTPSVLNKNNRDQNNNTNKQEKESFPAQRIPPVIITGSTETPKKLNNGEQPELCPSTLANKNQGFNNTTNKKGTRKLGQPNVPPFRKTQPSTNQLNFKNGEQSDLRPLYWANKNQDFYNNTNTRGKGSFTQSNLPTFRKTQPSAIQSNIAYEKQPKLTPLDWSDKIWKENINTNTREKGNLAQPNDSFPELTQSSITFEKQPEPTPSVWSDKIRAQKVIKNLKEQRSEPSFNPSYENNQNLTVMIGNPYNSYYYNRNSNVQSYQPMFNPSYNNVKQNLTAMTGNPYYFYYYNRNSKEQSHQSLFNPAYENNNQNLTAMTGNPYNSYYYNRNSNGQSYQPLYNPAYENNNQNLTAMTGNPENAYHNDRNLNGQSYQPLYNPAYENNNQNLTAMTGNPENAYHNNRNSKEQSHQSLFNPAYENNNQNLTAMTGNPYNSYYYNRNSKEQSHQPLYNPAYKNINQNLTAMTGNPENAYHNYGHENIPVFQPNFAHPNQQIVYEHQYENIPGPSKLVPTPAPITKQDQQYNNLCGNIDLLPSTVVNPSETTDFIRSDSPDEKFNVPDVEEKEFRVHIPWPIDFLRKDPPPKFNKDTYIFPPLVPIGINAPIIPNYYDAQGNWIPIPLPKSKALKNNEKKPEPPTQNQFQPLNVQNLSHLEPIEATREIHENYKELQRTIIEICNTFLQELNRTEAEQRQNHNCQNDPNSRR